MEPDLSALQKLREPVPATEIDLLPKGIKKNPDGSRPAKTSCSTCGGWHEPVATHLDYLGHAAATRILLDVDPLWNWEPVTVDERGPVLDRNAKGEPVGLWIKLTIAGVTRLGYGSVDSAKSEAVKELIGDAIRNAAMRFGLALDLWRKESHRQASESVGATTRRRTATQPRTASRQAKAQEPTKPQLPGHVKRLWALAHALKWDNDRVHAEAGVSSLNDLSAEQGKALADSWQKMLNDRAKMVEAGAQPAPEEWEGSQNSLAVSRS